jgi:hypothetical protein
MRKTMLLIAATALLASSAAFGFNPQPDPPGRHGAVAGAPAQTAFNPQPDPPGARGATACPHGIIAPRDASSGLGSGKRTTDGSLERKSGGQNFPVAGAGSSGDACGFEQPK